ncbi:MAG TPA: antibiotic biosynthesis monooxygenase [Mucilaginibacter sp.]|jgi:heme-degrading monooxygenase HmoA|nr:antibiotic biosynthesis monooxygenase [Mucilaginibacter sp.]
MIARHWKGLAKNERAADYIEHLQNETFKTLAGMDGFVKATILSRKFKEGTEFLVITEWRDIDAIKQFAGEAFETAVVPQAARDMMISFDPAVSHYEIRT